MFINWIIFFYYKLGKGSYEFGKFFIFLYLLGNNNCYNNNSNNIVRRVIDKGMVDVDVMLVILCL